MPRYVIAGALAVIAAGAGLWVLTHRDPAPAPAPAPEPAPEPAPTPTPTPAPAPASTAAPAPTPAPTPTPERPKWAHRRADRLSIALAHLEVPTGVSVGKPECGESRCEIAVTGKTDEVIHFLSALRKDRSISAGTKSINYTRRRDTDTGTVRSVVAIEYPN